MADTKIDTSCFIGKIVKIKEDNCFTEQFAGVLGEVLDITEKDYINSKYFAVVNWEKPINGLTYIYNHNGTKYNNVYEISLRCLEIVENIYDYTKELTLKLSNEILSKNTIIPKIKENIYEKGEIKMNNIDELMQIYFAKRIKEFDEYKEEEIKKIKENDEVQQLLEEFKINLCQLKKIEMEDMNVEIDGITLTDESLEKFDILDEEINQKREKLTLLCNEVKALFKIADTYEEKMKILMDYDIIDKKTKRLK